MSTAAFFRSSVAAWVLLFVGLSVPAAASLGIEGTPQSFVVGPQGELTCQGTTEDACAFYDELPTPRGMFYVVQGAYSRPRDVRDKRPGPDYINFYFALLCQREGNVLKPTFSFLEGRERASDLHFCDLDGDGSAEVIVAAVFGPIGSYASVYRLTGPQPERIFYRRANTSHVDFEISDGGVPTLILEQRELPAGRESRQEVFAWNGTTFVPKN